jgi:hypothetical protein
MGSIQVSKVLSSVAVKASMNDELPFISDRLLLELGALITTWEAIRKANGMGPITEDSIEPRLEVAKLLAAFDTSSP